MAMQSSKKILLVEGIDDQKVIEKLLKRHKITPFDFGISNCEGIDKLLRLLPDVLEAGSYEVIGIIVDADENVSERWQTIRDILSDAGYEDVPRSPDRRGIILKDVEEELPVTGIWIMPDNQAKGAIEDFIRLLIPEKDDLLPIAWQTVSKLISDGKNRFQPSQQAKALIHTWLAWQERPGKQLGSAITFRVTKTQEYLLNDGKASPLINWLNKLFR